MIFINTLQKKFKHDLIPQKQKLGTPSSKGKKRTGYLHNQRQIRWKCYEKTYWNESKKTKVT